MRDLRVYFTVAAALFFMLLKPVLSENTTAPVPDNTLSARTQTEPTQRVRWMGHWLGNDLRHRLLQEVTDDFRFRHPEIDLHLKFPQEIMGIRSKPVAAKFIADMIRSGKTEWDVIWLDDLIYRYVAEELDDPDWGPKYLVNFLEIPGFAETQKWFIVVDPVYRNQTGGILVGPYIEGYYLSLWYNKDVAEEIGVTVPQRGMTFDRLLEIIKKTAEYNTKAQFPIAAFYEARDWLTLEMLFQSLVKSEFEHLHQAIDETYTEKKKRALMKGLRAFETLGEYNPLIHSHNTNVWANSRDLILNDKALFYCHGTWMYSLWREIYEKRFEDKMIPVELPVFKKVSHSLGGYIPTWAVMKNSPNKEAAISLMMSWCRPQVAEKWVAYTKNPTGLRGNFQEAEMSDNSDPYEQYISYMSDTYGADVNFSPDAGWLLGGNNSGLQSTINKELRLLLTGKTTADAAFRRISATRKK